MERGANNVKGNKVIVCTVFSFAISHSVSSTLDHATEMLAEVSPLCEQQLRGGLQ